MRNFNADERELLNFIVSKHKEVPNPVDVIQPIYVYDVFAEKVSNIKGFIQIYVNENYVEVRLPLDCQRVSTIQYQIENDFAIVISLIDYLEKNNLIKLLPIDGSIKNKISFHQHLELISSPNKIQLFKGDFSKYNYIYEDINDAIFPTSELVEFVNKGFKDEEQLRHDANVKLQKRSINLATSLGVISIIVSLISLVPEVRKQQIFGNIHPVKQQVNNKRTSTVISKETQINIIKAKSRETPKPQLLLPDTLKK